MRVLLIGGGDLADEVAAGLEVQETDLVRLAEPDEREVREALERGDLDRVTVVSRDDAVALRMALMVRYQDEAVPLLVTLFDETAAAHLRAADEHIEITSMAEIVAPSLAGPCIAEDLAAVRAAMHALVDDQYRCSRGPTTAARRSWSTARSACSRCSLPRRSARCSSSTRASSTRSTGRPRRS